MTPPDLAALARELVKKLLGHPSEFRREMIEEALTLSRTAGRAEGLGEVAKAVEAKAEHYASDGELWVLEQIVRDIRALASDPAPGEQVAETARRGCAACYGACPSDPCPYDRAAPAHPAEPGEIERLRAIETAAREYRRMAWDQTPFKLWADAGLALDAALSAPQPKGETAIVAAAERRCLHPGSCGRHGMCMYPTFPTMTPCADDPAALSKGPTP